MIDAATMEEKFTNVMLNVAQKSSVRISIILSRSVRHYEAEDLLMNFRAYTLE